MHTYEHDPTAALEIIEQACRDHPFCAACGEATRPVAHGDVVWLECPSIAEHKSRLARVVSFQAGHTKLLLLDHASTSGLAEVS